MARNLGNLIMNNLVGGLITEVGALNFPAGGASATENCIWTQKKTVKRRFGFNFETGNTQQQVSPSPIMPTFHAWYDMGISADGSKCILTDTDDVFISFDSGASFTNMTNGSLGTHIKAVDVSRDGTVFITATGTFGSKKVFTSSTGSVWDDTLAASVNWGDVVLTREASAALASDADSGDYWFYNIVSPTWTNQGSYAPSDDVLIGYKMYGSTELQKVLALTLGQDAVTFATDGSSITDASDFNSPTFTGTWGCISDDGTHMSFISNQDDWIYSSNDSGTSWNLIQPLTATGPFLAGNICCDETGINLIMSEYQTGFTPRKIYSSSNQGDDWIDIGAPPQIYEFVDCSHDGSIIIAPTDDQGVFVSVDSGASWSQTII